MLDSEVLSQMIKDTALVPLDYKYGRPFVKLCEPKISDSKVIIHNLPEDAIVIKVDAFRSPDDIFRCKNGECKRADFIIISTIKKCILHIEIKRSKDGWDQIVKQLIGAQCFVKYCQEIGKAFWRESLFLNGYRHRFISIGHTSIAKRRTRIDKKAKRHDTPDKAMKIDWPNYLQFNQLAGMGG